MANALKIGVAGLGTVGASLVRILQTRANALTVACGRPISVAAVSARDASKDRGILMDDIAWYADPVEMAKHADIDVFVELVGGAEGAAEQSVRAALTRGLHVVTANKALLSRHGVEFARLAEEKGRLLNYEAAVAGGIPVIKTLRESLTGNNFSRIYGIMNGTCNYILTRMEREGLSFADCLKEAQRLGYAEADPSFDIEGNDTAHKLSILTTLAFGCEISADKIYLEGITNISIEDIHAAADLGYRIKLLGVAQKTESGIEQRVHPTMVPLDSVIAQVDGVTNAVALESDILGELLMVGPGAGGDATASAVLGDITDIAKSRPGAQEVPVLGRPAHLLEPYRQAEMQSHEGGYFIRLTVQDRTGVFASIATRMAENAISLESIVQHSKEPATPGRPQTIILVTHATMESAVRTAVDAIQREGYLIGEPQVIRIERPKS
ncbi:MAG: homoserine dehydrogenase [Alphaproteobacteria bacterium]|jgi:homoserine dehydrogenase|uniref:Homoserine dehydrogenase n=1 Tax=Peteryoungia algae TaxID=2919917 RepID=A0ABT0D1J5_9HYPH|nr:homoserine dehydrogenase [Rhizobium sp. SSM4.3]MBU2329133.1 homoserine dehydrogenase [Alphaproteobacteria bacterium]MCJ8239287.1 homoserine dehydrogenase [Rhizobium sp. SSM4.3]